jgi:hypothetical protein
MEAVIPERRVFEESRTCGPIAPPRSPRAACLTARRMVIGERICLHQAAGYRFLNIQYAPPSISKAGIPFRVRNHMEFGRRETKPQKRSFLSGE